MASLFRVTVKPGLLKKDNPCKQETVKKIRRRKKKKKGSQRISLFLQEVAEYSD